MLLLLLLLFLLGTAHRLFGVFGQLEAIGLAESLHLSQPAFEPDAVFGKGIALFLETRAPSPQFRVLGGRQERQEGQ